MNLKWKKPLAMLLVVCMLLTILPVAAFAEGEPPVAQIGNAQYNTLQEAVTAAGTTPSTITLLNDTTEDITIAKDQTITLDLGNYTLTNKNDHTIINNGKLTVEGSGTVDNVTHARAALHNGVDGIAVLNGGNFIRSLEAGKSATDNGGNSYYVVLNHGTMTITDGVKVEANGKYSSLIENGWQNGNQNTSGTDSVLTINGGTFTGGLNTIKNDDYGNLTINGGDFNNVAQHAVMNWNVAKITDGTFESTGSCAVWNGYGNDTMDQGQLEITGGTFKAPAEYYVIAHNNAGGSVSISGGTYSSQYVSNATDYLQDGDVRIKQADGTYQVGTPTDDMVKDENGIYFVDENLAQAGNVAVVDGTYYSTLSAAISAASAGATVKLIADVTESETVASDKDIDLDLNGKTLTSPDNDSVTVKGCLTVQDSAGNGKIAVAKAISVNGANAVLTVNGGTIESATDYGIYALNGGSVTVNDGVINSLDAPLTGNNTTGDMNFTVNGGILTAKRGPTIYMPGQGNLTITAGTLNGGISLRMGQVHISGGTINAVTENIDDPADYYDWSGNAWLPDALYVFGGTYTSENEDYGNSLSLTITGGTFNCTNEQGSAIAIYDLGKTEQSTAINISDDAVLNTNAENRSAYQVLSLADIGVETPEAGYGNDKFVGKVDSAISGGSYSTSVSEYVVDGLKYEANADGMYTYHADLMEALATGGTVKTISAANGEDTYMIIFDNDGVTTSIEAVADETITLPTVSRSGYTFAGWYAGDILAGDAGDSYIVTGAVTLTAKWNRNISSGSSGGFSGTYNYPVKVDSTGDATVTLDKNYAVAGDQVTITVQPKSGRAVDEVIVTDKGNNVIAVTKVGDNQYSFTMPSGQVKVAVTTKAAAYDKRIVLQINNRNVLINNNTLSNDVAPVIVGNRTMVPIRVITEALGGKADWNAATQTVTLTIDGSVLRMTIGQTITGFDAAPVIINDRTYVPIRYVAEKLGANVEWIANTQQIIIEK